MGGSTAKMHQGPKQRIDDIRAASAEGRNWADENRTNEDEKMKMSDEVEPNDEKPDENEDEAEENDDKPARDLKKESEGIIYKKCLLRKGMSIARAGYVSIAIAFPIRTDHIDNKRSSHAIVLFQHPTPIAFCTIPTQN